MHTEINLETAMLIPLPTTAQEKLMIYSHLLEKSLMGNFIFSAVYSTTRWID